MDIQVSNMMMIIVYWILSAFWVCVVGLTLSYLTWRPLYREAPQPKRIMYGFLVLAIIFLLDSLYWSLANTSRVGLMSTTLSEILYKSWLVALIKAVFLIAAIPFWITVVRTYGQIEQRIEALYFTQFADQIVDAIGVLSPKGVVVYWNEGAEKLYGQPRKRVLGMHIKDFLVPPRLHKNIEEILYKIRYSQQPDRFIAPRLRYDRTEIMVDITISPFFHSDGDFGGYFGIMRPAAASSSKIKHTPLRLIEEDALNTGNTIELNNSGELVRGVAEVIASEEKQFVKRQRLAGAFALILLLFTFILLAMTLIYDEPQKYIFVVGSLLTIISEIWPLRFLIKNRRENFRGLAVQKILELPNVDIEQLKLSLDIIDAVGQRLHSETERTPESSTKLKNLKIM